MAMFDYTLDDSMVGRVLTPADGFLVNLTRTKSPIDDGPPRAAPGGTWLSGRLQLRGEKDFRDLYCGDSMSVGPSPGPTMILIADSSLPYRGGLLVRAVQKGAVYSLTLSDVENVRSHRDTVVTTHLAQVLTDRPV